MPCGYPQPLLAVWSCLAPAPGPQGTPGRPLDAFGRAKADGQGPFALPIAGCRARGARPHVAACNRLVVVAVARDHAFRPLQTQAGQGGITRPGHLPMAVAPPYLRAGCCRGCGRSCPRPIGRRCGYGKIAAYSSIASRSHSLLPSKPHGLSRHGRLVTRGPLRRPEDRPGPAWANPVGGWRRHPQPRDGSRPLTPGDCCPPPGSIGATGARSATARSRGSTPRVHSLQPAPAGRPLHLPPGSGEHCLLPAGCRCGHH